MSTGRPAGVFRPPKPVASVVSRSQTRGTRAEEKSARSPRPALREKKGVLEFFEIGDVRNEVSVW